MEEKGLVPGPEKKKQELLIQVKIRHKLQRAWLEKESPRTVDLIKDNERELTIGERLRTLVQLAQNERRKEK